MENIKFKNLTLPRELVNTYGTVGGLSLQDLFYTRFNNSFPSCYLFEYSVEGKRDFFIDTAKLLSQLCSSYSTDNLELSIYYTKELDSEKDDRVGFCFVLKEEKIMGRIERYPGDTYILFDHNNYDCAKKFVDEIIKPFFIAPEEKKNVYWKICASQEGFYLGEGKIKCPEDFVIDKYYNDDFLKEDIRIKKYIEEKDKSGLVILHGEKGTGKSTYIKHLVNKYPDKRFVYVPAHLISLFGEPHFGSFLTTLNNDIVVLEDCESVIRNRTQNATSSAVSLLLNLTDGILSDDLGMKFICTFNEDMNFIDEALLRKGRLISKYEFKELAVEKTNKIFEELGYDVTTDKPLSLANIFHYNEESYDNKKYRPIGLK